MGYLPVVVEAVYMGDYRESNSRFLTMVTSALLIVSRG